MFSNLDADACHYLFVTCQQRVIIVHVSVDTNGLYKIQFSYVNPGGASVANVTLTPVLAVGKAMCELFLFCYFMSRTLWT